MQEKEKGPETEGARERTTAKQPDSRAQQDPNPPEPPDTRKQSAQGIAVHINGLQFTGLSPEEIVQLYMLAKLDRGGQSMVEIRADGRLRTRYNVTRRMGRAMERCLMARCTIPLQAAFEGLCYPILGDNPVKDELVRMRDRCLSWTGGAP